MTFIFINCYNNQRVLLKADNYDQALRCCAQITGHYCLVFISSEIN